MAVLVLAIAVVLFTIVPTLASVLAAKGLGLGVPAVDFGVWGPKLKARLGASKFSVTPWLFTSSYIIKDFPNLDLYSDAPGKPFNSINPLIRAAVIIFGPLFVLFFCTFILGAADALSSFTSGYGQIFAGAVSPLGHAQTLLSKFWQSASFEPLSAVAIALTKFAAFSLLPLPSLPGGNAILQLARWRRPDYPPSFGGLLQLGLLVVLLVALSWIAAFLWFSLHGGAI